MRMKLSDGSDGSDEDISKIKINNEFARRYEHNKKREDLQRLEELKKKGLVEDSSGSDFDESSSDELAVDELINSRKDLEFFNALIKVKNQPPELRTKEAKLFESEGEEDEDEEEKESEKEKPEQGMRDKKEKKPMYLKDVAVKHLIEEGPEFEDKVEKRRVTSYSEEQEELRRAFLDAAEDALDGDEGGELLKEKKCNRVRDGDDDDDTNEVQKKFDEYFGKDDNLDENEIFLKDYFWNGVWIDEGKSGKGLDENVLGFSEDEEEIEKQEDYEREFNFRFEENAGNRVLGHLRFVEGSVRKKTNAR